MLARNLSIKVTILDASTEIDKNPRAAHYAPSAMFDFKRAGILDEVREKGLSPRGVCWRLDDTTFLAGMGRDPEDTELAMRVLPLDQLGPLVVRHFKSYPNTEILWGHKVVGVKQDENGATAIVETADGEKKEITGDYLVGADGASSGVRTALFGKEYPGETLPQQIVATNVSTHLRSARAKADVLGLPAVRRAVRLLGLQLHRAPDRLVHGCQDHKGRHLASHLRRRRQPLARGNHKAPASPIRKDPPRPSRARRIQACQHEPLQAAATMRKELPRRQDPACRRRSAPLQSLVSSPRHPAPHNTNSRSGGLGLTGGFADVGSLYDCFMGIHQDELDESILDKYSEIRTKIWREMIDPMSRANFHRLWDPACEQEKEEFFKFCEKADKDPVWGKSVAEAVHAVRHDFTQYFKSKQKVGADASVANGAPAVQAPA